MQQPERAAHFRHNFTYNILDGTFFGMGLGFASFVTIIPLFVNTLTDSTLLIGLIPAIHTLGWQLPQLFTASRVARLPRYKPMALRMTLQERWPFFGLAVVALLSATISPALALGLTFLMLIWQGLGAGLTATPWQSMITKIMPPNRVGLFYGSQNAAANLTAGVGAIIAGAILLRFDNATGFALCFGIAGGAMVISLLFLARTREAPVPPPPSMSDNRADFWPMLGGILRRDPNFRWFLVARLLLQFAFMAVGFFTIYAVRRFAVDEQTAGVMTGIYLFTQTLAGPIIGIVGDRWGHRLVYIAGALLVSVSALAALFAPGPSWFYLIYGLAGAANAVFWTATMSIIVEFGTLAERPYYIGLTNTLIAPATLLAPIIGGWLVDAISFEAMFVFAAATGVLAVGVLTGLMRDPRVRLRQLQAQEIA
jgi:MFS family permease